MATTTGQITVSTAAVALTVAETDTVEGIVVWLRNTDASNGCAVGGSGVTAGTGFRVGPTTTLGPLAVPYGEQLYAIRTGAADVVVDVLRFGT